MPEQKIILSVIGQVLAGTQDDQLLKFIGMVNQELDKILFEFSVKQIQEMIDKEINDGQSSDMASNQVGAE
jgi:hypothetical protein